MNTELYKRAMTSIPDLINTIVCELRRAQTARWEPPAAGPLNRLDLPPSLPVGDGRHLNATTELLQAISDYAEIYLRNNLSAQKSFKSKELLKLTEQAFGQVLHAIDLEKENEHLIDVISQEVRSLLVEWIDQHHCANELTLGCYLFRGESAYPMRVGPVLFETRNQWHERAVRLERLKPVTARRLMAHWNGKSIKKRKPSFDMHCEEAIIKAIGECPSVCTVDTNSLSGRNTQEKGVLAARLAMTAISFMWSHPSDGMRWMNLLYDRRVSHRYTVVFNESGRIGSTAELVHMPDGKWTNADLIESLLSYQSFFDQIGQVLFSYVQPGRLVNRPNITNALFLSLWWFHEACREPLDQIATTKFAASMDALVGGRGADSIIRFIGKQIGHQPDDEILKNGGLTKDVIKKIYKAGRSQFIHGTSTDYAHDWSQLRSSAEVIGRLCIISTCDWISINSGSDDISLLFES